MANKEQVKPKESTPKPDFKQVITQLEQAKADEQVILKRGLQTFLGSIDNVININNKIIDVQKTELNKND